MADAHRMTESAPDADELVELPLEGEGIDEDHSEEAPERPDAAGAPEEG